MKARGLWAALGLCAAAMAAGASTFTIAPIRVQLGAAHHSAALTLTNVEEGPVVVQVRAFAWSQQGGEDHLDDTQDVLVSPAVLQIPGNGAQIVRVALRGAPDPTRELTYRLLFDEVPQAAPAGFNGLRVSLRLSVPLFVAPVHGTPSPNLQWELRPLPGGDVEVAAVNEGTAHLQVADFDVQVGADTPLHAKTSKYLLPGGRMLWQLQPEAPLAAQGSVVIHGHSDQGDFTSPIASSGL